jgi:hypothetical protein
LADAFAARGESVILADLSLQKPELHALLQSENEEGLTDVFLFGASLEHIALPVAGRSFRLIPASPVTPDAREVLQHRRWRGVFEQLAQERSKLLVYLPMDIDGAAAFSDRVGHTIVLAAPPDMEQMEALLSNDADVIGLLTPVAETAAETPTVGAAAGKSVTSPVEKLRDEEFEKIRIPKDNAREALIADLRARQRAALMSPPPAMEPLPLEESVPSMPRRPLLKAERGPSGAEVARPFALDETQPPPKRFRGWLTWVLLLLVVSTVSAGAWYMWQTRFAATARLQPITQPPPAPQPQPETQPLADAAPPGTLPYSVAIASYQDLTVAQQRLEQLLRQEPAIPFYVGPIVVQGRLFYRIMAGPVADSASAVMVRDSLILKRIKTISSGWDVVNTRYAFLLGEHARRADAEAQRKAVASKGVPSYVVATTSPDGFVQYNVYAGAYMGPGDAEFMRPILRSAGLPDNLVERTGSNRS